MRRLARQRRPASIAGMMILGRLGVLSDEISDDFREALDWLGREGIGRVEIRTVDGVNVAHLTDEHLARTVTEVQRRGLLVSAVASPLFKCALDQARRTAPGDSFGAPEEDVTAHLARLPRIADIARALGTRDIRVFSFWREREPQRHFAEIADHLRRAADVASSLGVRLLLENEPSCNGGHADEVAALVRQVGSPALRVLWDPGNEAWAGRAAFPDGYQAVRGLVGHVHLKDAVIGSDGKARCVPIGAGRAKIAAQIRALERDGYTGLYTIETHHVPDGGSKTDGTALTLAGLRRLLASAAAVPQELFV